MNPTEKRNTYINKAVNKAVDQVNSTENKQIRKMQDQGNQTKKKENIRKIEFDTMSLLLEFDKPTDNQKKGNQRSEKKMIMEK